MDNATFPKAHAGDLLPTHWVRLADGCIGMIRDQVDQPGYQKVCVEVPGSRQPMRFLGFDTVVEHITDEAWRRLHTPRRFAA